MLNERNLPINLPMYTYMNVATLIADTLYQVGDQSASETTSTETANNHHGRQEFCFD